MTVNTICTISGLLLDAAGTILLFAFGIPRRLRARPTSSQWDVRPPPPSEIAKDARYDKLGWLGLGCILIGTLFQIIGA